MNHRSVGVFLLVLYLLQVGLGRYIHRRRAAGLVPSNKRHPPSNILHVLMGISVITFAFVQVTVAFFLPLRNRDVLAKILNESDCLGQEWSQ